jgi:hypothetical protein
MEELLWLYALPYDPKYPVVCFDERPCFLIGDRVEPIAMQTGQVRKEHYAYEKHGSCALLAAIELLTGFRLAQVHPQRTKKEYMLFCQALAAQFPEAIKIRLVQDNLNTHDTSAFYENLPADQARALAERFEFYFTPKSASWLNMIEIEFSALTRLGLKRRIPTIEALKREILAIVADRKSKQITITWQFSIQSARSKLNSHYVKVHPENSKFRITYVPVYLCCFDITIWDSIWGVRFSKVFHTESACVLCHIGDCVFLFFRKVYITFEYNSASCIYSTRSDSACHSLQYSNIFRL